LKADELWNLDFSGTDGYSDTLTITGTISTQDGTSGPYTIDKVNLFYDQSGFPGASGEINEDSSTTVTNFDNASDLVYTSGPYLDDEGLSFLLEGGQYGTDYKGDVKLYNDEGTSYCVPIDDDPSFCGTLTVTPATAAPSATPEPASLELLGLGLLALPAAMFFRRQVNSL
jgi:hypothetical protein